MTPASPWNRLTRLFEDQSLQPDLGRAIRATLGYMVPLLLATAGHLPWETTFVALVAQNVAMVDVRGAYAVRLGLLLAMTAILSGAVLLGALASPHLLTAVLGMGLMALLGGLWRHLNSDYGVPLATASILVYLLAASAPVGSAVVVQHAVAALAGGLWGVTLQVINWPFRPQHPLRRAVADSWLAVADLFEAMAPQEDIREAQRLQHVAEREAALRTILDKSYSVLTTAGAAARPSAMLPRLERLNLAAARLATRVVAFNTAFETLMTQPEFAGLLPSFLPSLTSLTNTSRTIALAVVSRQPEHLATADVRLLRLSALLRVLQTRVTAQTPATPARGQLLEILRQIDRHLPEVREALRATITRAGERAAFSLELLDVHTWSLRPLASALNLGGRIDPALIRFSIRLAVFTMLGVVIFKAVGLPHGYWLPFTMVVVLQPDYGSTRQRAAQRVAGTVAGSILASLLLWLHLPFPLLTLATAATIFTFGFLVKRNYGLAVFFVTLFIVLLTEANGPVTVAFTGERLGSTLVGGAISLLAALFFWPVWERDRFPPVLAQALRSNRDYLRLLAGRLASGGSYDAEAIAAKRRAEAANSSVFSSLQRMIGDPKNQREGIERAAALANGNQRLTRALTIVTLHLTPGRPLAWPEIARFSELASTTLETLAEGIASGAPGDERLDALLRALEEFRFPTPSAAPFAAAAESDAQRDHWVFTQLSRSATELSAMLLAAKSDETEPDPAAAE